MDRMPLPVGNIGQPGSVTRPLRGGGQALLAGPREDPHRDADRHDGNEPTTYCGLGRCCCFRPRAHGV